MHWWWALSLSFENKRVYCYCIFIEFLSLHNRLFSYSISGPRTCCRKKRHKHSRSSECKIGKNLIRVWFLKELRRKEEAAIKALISRVCAGVRSGDLSVYYCHYLIHDWYDHRKMSYWAARLWVGWIGWSDTHTRCESLTFSWNVECFLSQAQICSFQVNYNWKVKFILLIAFFHDSSRVELSPISSMIRPRRCKSADIVVFCLI